MSLAASHASGLPAGAAFSVPPSARIVIRGVNWLGDAVMSTAALIRLREALPQAHLTLFVQHKLAELWLGHPALDQIIVFPPKCGIFQAAAQLKPGRFDIGLLLPNSPRSAFELWLARIPRRVGMSRLLAGTLLTDVVPPRPSHEPMRKLSASTIRQLNRENHESTQAPRLQYGIAPKAIHSSSGHHLHHYLHLVSFLGANPTPLAPRINVAEVEKAVVRQRFFCGNPETASRPFIALNAGAEYGAAKRWPVDRFAAVVRQVSSQRPCSWIIVGGPGDRALAKALEKTARASSNAPGGSVQLIQAAGQTSLRELAALFSCCRVVLTNDTGPMHLAAAVGTSVVAVFGSTSPELTGPGLPGDSAHTLLRATSPPPCAPCFLRQCPIDSRCLTNIPAEAAVRAVLQKLGS